MSPFRTVYTNFLDFLFFFFRIKVLYVSDRVELYSYTRDRVSVSIRYYLNPKVNLRQNHGTEKSIRRP